MSEGRGGGLDEVLERLEKEIARLAEGTAPVEDLVAGHETAQKLIDQAQAELRSLMAELAPPPEPGPRPR